MFGGNIRRAVMAKVNERIIEAQSRYDEECLAIDKGYADAINRAASLAQTSKDIAEEKAIDSVIGKLL